MAQTKKTKVELTKKEVNYISGLVELYKGKLEVFDKKSAIVKREIRYADRVGKKFSIA